jgi:hypothetical protein
MILRILYFNLKPVPKSNILLFTYFGCEYCCWYFVWLEYAVEEIEEEINRRLKSSNFY